VADINLSGLAADIARYAQRLTEEATLAQQKATFVIRDRVRDRAREMGDWAHLADDIQVWSQDGMLVIGVNNQELVSEVMLLEYGDETTPPSPLFRTATAEVQAGQQVADQHMAGFYERNIH
jgi:hypothetical protein